MALKPQLKKHEGTGPVKNGRFMPYRDSVGKMTIGWGRNLDDRGISEWEAEFLLQNDIDQHLQELITALPWVATLAPVRRDVLADMAFNLGVPKLLKFENTLVSIKRGKYELAAVQMLQSHWASQVGSRALTLAKMMRSGVSPFGDQ